MRQNRFEGFILAMFCFFLMFFGMIVGSLQPDGKFVDFTSQRVEFLKHDTHGNILTGIRTRLTIIREPWINIKIPILAPNGFLKRHSVDINDDAWVNYCPDPRLRS